MIELIINGDDFGYSELINNAIIESFKMGAISSTTIMSNMPGFDNACSLAHENNIINFIGVHLNLTEGRPLTENIRRIPKFCDNEGQFCLSREKPIFTLNTEEKDAVFKELEAQILQCRKKGIPLTHADSHEHIHTEWSICHIVIRLAKLHKIPFIRLTRNIGKDIPPTKMLYKWIYNNHLRLAGFSRTQYFGNYDDFIYLQRKKKNKNFSCETMVHPVINSQNEVVDKNMKLLSLKKYIDNNSYALDIASFSDTRE